MSNPTPPIPDRQFLPLGGEPMGLRLTLFARFYNLFATYLNLNCFFVSVDQPFEWMPLFYSRNSLHNPTHYESLFGKNEDRYRYNEANVRRLQKERRTFFAKHRGFYDLFTPIFVKGEFKGFLASGSFVREPFTEAEIGRQWASLTGRRAQGGDPEFLGYARMALDTVVLSPPVLRGFVELLGLLAEFLMGRSDKALAQRLEELRKGPISHGLPHAIWMDFMLGLEKFHPRVDLAGTPNWWEQQELGITRYPTTVLAVTQPAPALEKWSAIRSMVVAAKLQWEALRVAREFPETVAGKLEDYGALFVTSPSPGKSKVQAKLEIRDRMEAIRRRLEKRIGSRLVAGAGSALAPGAKLMESRLESVMAVNLAASTGRPMVFYEDEFQTAQIEKGSGLRPALEWLKRSYRSGSAKEREAARAEFVRQALLYSHERHETFRAHLLEAGYSLTGNLAERRLDPDLAEALSDSMEQRILGASTLREMLSAFREGLDRIGDAGDRPPEGRRLAGMEEVKRHVDRHFTQALRLKDLAKKAGLSQPSFLKGFKALTGQGFSRYLQGRRLEEAKRLLRSSRLSVERVAQEAGFNSASYFVQSFKRSTGRTPGDYRKGDLKNK